MTTTTQPIADTAGMLAAFGVRGDELSAAQREELDRNGYLLLPNVVDVEWLAALRARVSELFDIEGPAAGHEIDSARRRRESTPVLGDLLNKGEVFEQMLRIKPVLAAMHHVLGDFKVFVLNCRSAPPGEGGQTLHVDEHLRPDGSYKHCNSMWLLDDFTATNGATRVVPGSHRWGRLPADEMSDPAGDHPEQRVLTGNAGDVIVFNGHVWHGGTHNASDRPRRGLGFGFCRRDEPQYQTNQAERIRKRVYDRLSPAERFLLDV